MQTVTGACHFCGQIRQVEFEEDTQVTDDMADDRAMMGCDCGDARREQRRRKKIEKGRTDIDELFGKQENTYEVAEILNTALIHIVDGKLSKITVERGKIKAKISQTSKAGIKVERTVTQKDVLES